MVRFGRVTQRAERVLIVAGGPSAGPLTGITVPAGVHIIAVNGAADWLPRFDSWITVDPCREIRARMRNPRPGATYYAAVPSDYGTPDAACIDHREPPEPGIVWLRRLTGFGPLGARAGLSADPSAIHTGNSAYGALGLAVHMGARRVVLAGVDGDGRRRIDGGYPRDLGHLPELFASASDELEWRSCSLRNASPQSVIRAYQQIDLSVALWWLAE